MALVTRLLGAEVADVEGNVETTSGHVFLCTMHLAMGLEFRAVAVMACGGEVKGER